jgi:hypothetical protein
MDIHKLIGLFKKYSETTESISEQEGDASAPSAPSASPAGGGGSKYPTVTKWESGVTRGPANQIGNTKWSDIVKLNRGKANPIDTKSKWESGVKRGKGNTLI